MVFTTPIHIIFNYKNSVKESDYATRDTTTDSNE